VTAIGQPRSRSRLQRALDGAATRLLKLPAPVSDYTITRDLRIPTRDGVELLADLYAPTTTSRGTILVRSPYGWPLPMSVLNGGVYASRGYHVVLARCRGTFGSGGTFEPMVHEIDDAADTVAWLRTQSFFGKRLATLGGSYLGFTQWALLMDPPPELAAAVISIAPHDFHDAAYQGGAFNLNDFLGWSNMVGHQEDGTLRALLVQARGEREVAQVTSELPLVDAGERLLEGRAPWYRAWVSTRNAADPMWDRMKARAALDRVQVPVLLQTGWQDLFLMQTLEQYAHLRDRGVEVALTAGPWTHIGAAMKASRLLVRETLDWLDEHLAGNGIHTRAAPVKVFVTGAGQWRDLPSWPPPTDDRVLFLTGDDLGDDPAPAGTRAEFTYDPADPTPTIGGRMLARTGGYTDDTALAARRDVAVFTGPTLHAPLEVLGCPVLELAHTSDNPHADLFVRLSEVDPAGASRNVSEAFVRLDPAAATNNIRLELDAVAHRFAACNRIRLVVAGGSHPRWERNLGTDEDPATSSRLAPSHRALDLASSRLVLPVGRP
jgi:putative CocE/NonD family hydrolase